MEGAGAAAIVPDAAALNMMAAAAEQVDAAQPDEVPAVPTAVGGAPDDEADGAQVFPNDPRYLSACSIQPGCAKYTLAGWQPSSEKPEKKHLILAMGTRQLLPLERQPKPENWPVQKIADWLYKHPPTAAGPLVPAQLVPLYGNGTVRVGQDHVSWLHQELRCPGNRNVPNRAARNTVPECSEQPLPDRLDSI